jgi:hypothetical protein
MCRMWTAWDPHVRRLRNRVPLPLAWQRCPLADPLLIQKTFDSMMASADDVVANWTLVTAGTHSAEGESNSGPAAANGGKPRTAADSEGKRRRAAEKQSGGELQRGTKRNIWKQ